MPASHYYGFDLKPGTNQVARLRKQPPRDAAQIRKMHKHQWTDENRMLNGGFETMDKYANEVVTQSKRMPKNPTAMTTPLSDPHFVRSRVHTGTAVEALDTPQSFQGCIHFACFWLLQDSDRAVVAKHPLYPE